jgi:small subunit ribosomal protein S6
LNFEDVILSDMQSYELTIILPGDVSSAKKKATQESVEKIVKVLKGKVGKVEDWGKKEFAYEIKKNTSGVYLHFPLELGEEAIKALPQKLNLEEGIIRYLLVRKE